MVRAVGVIKENKGGQSNVRFVARFQDVDVIQQLATECVEHFTRETKAAFCYAYGTEADYDVKTPEWTPEWDETIYRPCFVLQAGQALAADEPSIQFAPTLSATYRRNAQVA